MLGRTELKASYQTYTPDTELPASIQLPSQETGKEQPLCTARAGKGKVGIYLPSPSTAAVVFCSTPFLETQQTAAKTVAGQRSRKGKMLLQNMQRLSYRLWWAHSCFKLPQLLQGIWRIRKPSIKAQYCTTWKGVTPHPQHLPTVEPAAQWLLPTTGNQECAKPSEAHNPRRTLI